MTAARRPSGRKIEKNPPGVSPERVPSVNLPDTRPIFPKGPTGPLGSTRGGTVGRVSRDRKAWS